MSRAEEIVKALAACEEPFYVIDESESDCELCEARVVTWNREHRECSRQPHKDDCPWRMAREYVAERDAMVDKLAEAQRRATLTTSEWLSEVRAALKTADGREDKR